MRVVGLCICSFFILVQVVSGSIIRGVAPFELQFYKEDPFKCRNEPNRIIPRSSINDNYCDCADGSDEPGTSACANGRYYCVNKGYKGTSIFSSQVNDGICDCCDGTDEYEGKVQCKNDCQEKGVELKKQREAEKERIQKGLQIKEQWVTEAEKTLAEKRGSIDGLKAEVEKLKKVVEDLEAEKRGFEEKERAEQDVINERRKELERLEQERLQKEVPPTPENEQTEQEALKELLENKEGEGEGEGEAKEEKPTQEEAPSDSHEEQPPQQPPATHSSKSRTRYGRHRPPITDGDGEGGEEQAPDTPQERQIPPEEETELLKTIREGKRKIEDELSQVRRDLSSAENKLKDTEEILKLDFGPNNEFFGLHGNCYEHKTREYTYSVCPFNEVKQGHTSLGKFAGWDPAHTVMSFTEGQQCWGGPKRSAKVSLICGAENELHDIQEPNKCEYSMKLNTPAACTPGPLELLNLEGTAVEEGHGSYFSQ